MDDEKASSAPVREGDVTRRRARSAPPALFVEPKIENPADADTLPIDVPKVTPAPRTRPPVAASKRPFTPDPLPEPPTTKDASRGPTSEAKDVEADAAPARKATPAKKATARKTTPPADKPPVKRASPRPRPAAEAPLAKTETAKTETATTETAEVKAPPVSPQAAPAEVKTPPAEVKAPLAEVNAPPRSKAAPAQVETPPAEVKTKPGSKAAPAQVKTSPAEVKTPPVKPEATPAGAETPPVKPEPTTAKAEAPPVKPEAPAKTDTPPAKVATADPPVKTAPAPTRPEPRTTEPDWRSRTPRHPAAPRPTQAELWAAVRTNPALVPAALALVAVERFGPEAARRARWLRDTYPTVPAARLSRAVVKDAMSRSRLATAVAAVPLGGVVGLSTQLWAQARLVLEIAAICGHDATDPDRAVDLLTLLRVYPESGARAAIVTLRAHAGGTTAEVAAEQPRAEKVTKIVGVRLARRAAARWFPGSALVFDGLSTVSATEALAGRTFRLYRDRPPR